MTYEIELIFGENVDPSKYLRWRQFSIHEGNKVFDLIYFLRNPLPPNFSSFDVSLSTTSLYEYLNWSFKSIHESSR